ncbi:MAG TPA: cation-translocating P-type ATPase [Verrucomicrobiae bacterium]|nr:cation-translocating P-type ATPase [Verrucomicrobiae bacterium]
MEIKGLTTSEAKLLQKEFGPNRISQPHSFHLLTAVLSQIFSMLNLLLIGAATFSIFIGDYADAILIFTIVVLNAAISFWQEYKAEKTLEELKKLSPTFSRVIRDGKEVMLGSEQLVPGDLVLLEVGDKIPADALVVEAVNFEANESILTGESIPVYKKTGESEHNEVYAGTLAASGRAKIKVLKIGNNTKFGRIAKGLGDIQEAETPLQKQIKKLALNLVVISVLLSGVIYSIGIALGYGRLEMFLTAISSAVAMVPEGLPSILLITMAVGVKRMAQKKAIVRKLVAIEGLGSVSILATDKTGTLTTGSMRVHQVWLNGKIFNANEFKGQLKHPFGRKIMDAMVIVNTSSLAHKFDKKSADVLGDTTEGALLLFAKLMGIDYELHRQQGKILDEFSFDQELKSMSAVWEAEGSTEALVKSAPEFLIKNSNRIAENGRVRKIAEAEKLKLTEAYQYFSKQGFRVLAFGYKDNVVRKTKYERAEVESDLILLGFVAIMDPLRPEVKAAINKSVEAGIKTIMITGDNELTALWIARNLGLAGEFDEAILGKELQKLTDEELIKVLDRVKVFARTTPEDKLRIVQTFQKNGYSVAVTGDGVNDALALKQAEIGVAMGKKGTDVAKEAADIVITDDNYATIVNAIEEGRTIYDNVFKSIRYLLSTNIGEVLAILIALILGLPAPLLPAQILWTNLVSDGLPALALAVDPKDPMAMRRAPREKNAKLLSTRVLIKLFSIGLIVALFSLSIYWYVLNTSDNLTLARTWAFTSLIFFQMIVAFIIHGKSKFNLNLLGAVIITLFIQFIILATPALHPIFEITKIW